MKMKKKQQMFFYLKTLISNLRCKTLTEFRWYKDSFLSRIFELKDCNCSHWKAKLVDGLPHLFAEKIRKTLKKDDVSVNYDHYTYRQLISTCITEGLSLCKDLRLNHEIKK